MSTVSLLLLCASVVTLLLGFRAWQLTSSNSICMNTVLGTAALAFAAYSASKPGGVTSAAAVAFFVAMIFGGRALGIFWRSRKDHELTLPSHLLFTVAATTLLTAIAVFCWR